MNITSFTSLDPNGMGNSSSSSSNNNNNNNSNDKNFDSSSTAYLTLNAANNVGQASTSTTCGNNSDSDQDVSPSVTVLRSITGNNHSNHHSHHLPRPSRLLTGGFSFSNRIQLTTKHQRTIWSRATYFEKLLLLALLVLFTISLLLFMFLGSVIMKQRNELRMFANTEAMGRNVDQEVEIFGEINSTVVALSSNKTKKYCLTPDCVKVAASVIEAIDLTVDPCDDFYLYSCGDWIKTNPLPDGKSNWGTFSKLWQDNQAIMRAVLEENNDFKSGSAEEKAKIYYESCLDRNDTVELRGTKPMQDFIESAGGWNISGLFDVKTWDLQSSLQIYHNQYNRGGLFSWAVGADERNSTRNIIQLDQGGLGLPSRDYYLNKTDKNIVLDAYLIYMIKVAELMGGTNVEEEMKEILEFEKKLALITVPQDQRRDDERMYNKFTLREFSKSSPFLNWTKYFDDAFDYHSKTTISFSSEIRPRQNRTDLADRLGNQTEYSMTTNSNSSSEPGKSNKSDQQEALRSTISKHKITDDEHIVIYAPEYFHDLAKLINEYSATDKGKVVLANYMAWSVIQTLIATLPKNFRDASKVLRKALIGSEGIEVSWRYCVTDTNQVMGFALGSLFVRRVFHGKSKERAEEMIFAIRNAFKDNLSNLSWMDDSTRSLAREKADYINQMIGFPDFILSPEKLNGKYEGLELDENNYFENNIKVNVLSLRENMEKLNKPANKTEWEMTPPMVNAYYTPTKNQIVFPAGILQTPFYDLSYPNSLNYGAMGVVMGHELTHAFDDQGREYDKDGNLYQWWYNETLKNFEERVKCFVDQYSSYKIDDNNLNGKQTLGENIADNGGLKAAFRAYEKWSERNPEPHLPGLNLTGKQLFFVGFAQVWCSLSTPEALKLQVLNDPHAPAQFRVIGTLSNSHEFAREFNCPAGSNMNPEKKCVVW